MNQPIIKRLNALATGAAVGYHRLDGITIRVTSGGFLIDEVHAWRDGDPAPTYQGRVEPGGGLGRFRAMTANGKADGQTDLLRQHGTGLRYEDALALVVDHRSQRPVKRAWDEAEAAEAALRAAEQFRLPPLVLYRADQDGAYYLEDGELIYVPMTVDGFLDFTNEAVCDGRCDPDIRAVQIECQQQLARPDVATQPGRVLVWLADPTNGNGYNAHWHGGPCWLCGYKKVSDPHHARPVPCTQPEAHVQVTLASWRSNGSTTGRMRLLTMTADELRARYGSDALPASAGDSPATGQNEVR